MNEVAIFCLFLVAANAMASAWIRRTPHPRPVQNKLIALVWLVPALGLLIAVNRSGRDGADSDDDPKLFLSEVKDPAPADLVIEGQAAFAIAPHTHLLNGRYAVLDWNAVHIWTSKMGPAQAAEADNLAKRAWLQRLNESCEPQLRLFESEHAFILSPLDDHSVAATARYIGTTRARIGKVLHGVAQFHPGDKSVLLVLPSLDDYYDYISCYYPEDGEYATSSGMFIDAGCPHFVVPLDALHAIEPVIAHEMTHSAVAYLDLPRWLNEGLAVNTEHRLTFVPKMEFTPQELHAKHLAFWNPETIQEFWSGESFFRSDDGNLLSYELARILVEHLARDWPPFAAFLVSATSKDAGEQAANTTLNTSLGPLACAFLELPYSMEWDPLPAQWKSLVQETAAETTPA